MGNIGRKLRKLRRSGNPQNRARAVAAGLAQGNPHSHAHGFHGHWLDVKTGRPDDFAGPEHHMECVFMGGVAGADECFACFLVANADRVIAEGEQDNFRNDDEGYCAVAVPDSLMQAPHQKMVIDGVAVPADWRLGRHDRRELFFWRLGEEHERDHATGAATFNE